MQGRRHFLKLSGALAALATSSPPGWTMTYPARPVRVIVPFAPGGPTDVAGRLLAQRLADHYGQQFNVENIGGAGGNIGTGMAAKAAPDGHTLLVAAASYAVNPSLFDKLPYDPQKDFRAVTVAATALTALTVHPSLPARNVEELVTLVRAHPGKYSYASPGPGTPPHLLGEQFRLATGLDLVHVPYNGGGQAIAATLAGHTPISFGALPPAVAHIKEGKLRVLAITSKARSPVLGDVPTLVESGYADIAADIWTAVLVPAATSDEIVAGLYKAITTIIALPDVKERMAALGYTPVGNPPDQCDAEMRREIAKWAKVVRDAGIKV